MQNDEKLFSSRIAELSARAKERSYYTNTEFLTLGQKTVIQTLNLPAPPVFSGGYGEAERCIAMFGSSDMFGYEPDFPIYILKISPKAPKFARQLSHRDFLGSLMALGMRREMFGDIIVHDNIGYVFVLDTASEYVKENLTSVSNVPVCVTSCDTLPDGVLPEPKRQTVIAASDRLDAICASVFDMSRAETDEMISKGLVLIDGIPCADRAKKLCGGERISVRGRGKFIFLGISGVTRHGKAKAEVDIY